MWYYKYDALGRRISKECPQQHLRIEYLWDGDQLAYTQTFKNGKLNSQRHSVFNGWQLIAQQDNYQTLVQHYEGNQTKWQHQTGYAICQPNGQVLALLNPKGRTLWRKEKQTLWGLCFPNSYYPTSPLDPQMLFAGQWIDEESGLAYNRFRYYDPNSGNYISSDPIGLSGGERPFGYVGNPMDWVDLFGLAGCKGMGVKNSGHHVPSVRKSKGRPFEISRNDKTRPTLHPKGNNPENAHWRLHDAERGIIGPRQGDFIGTDAQLFDAYRKAYENLDDILVDVKSPNGTYTLGINVTPLKAVDLIEDWLISTGLHTR